MDIRIRDPIGNAFSIEVPETGERVSIREALTRHDIPPSFVIARQEGTIVTEDRPLTPETELQVVRPLDIRHFIEYETETERTDDPVYVDRRLTFDYDVDTIRMRRRELNAEQFVTHFETTVADTIDYYDMLPDDGYVFALSGGKDSISLFAAMQEQAERIDAGECLAVTLEGWGLEQENTYRYTKEITDEYGVDHVTIPKSEIESVFNLTAGFDEVKDAVVADTDINGKTETMIFAQIQRRLLEVEAADHGYETLCFGLNKEDLLSEIVLTFTSGHLASSLPVRPAGSFEYVYPLAFLSKKETLLYVLNALSRYADQEETTPIEVGADTSHFYMKIVGDLCEKWPGIEYQLYPAYEEITRYMLSEITWGNCENCGSSIVEDGTTPHDPLCGACQIFLEKDVIETA